MEDIFSQLPADVRLTILSALQDRIMFARTAEARDAAADVVTRLGYPGTAESAQRVRTTLDSL